MEILTEIILKTNYGLFQLLLINYLRLFKVTCIPSKQKILNQSILWCIYKKNIDIKYWQEVYEWDILNIQKSKINSFFFFISILNKLLINFI